jgi:hypothetical protein
MRIADVLFGPMPQAFTDLSARDRVCPLADEDALRRSDADAKSGAALIENEPVFLPLT